MNLTVEYDVRGHCPASIDEIHRLHWRIMDARTGRHHSWHPSEAHATMAVEAMKGRARK